MTDLLTPVAIGLGGNLGDAPATLADAVAALDAHPDLHDVQTSPLFRSAPIGPAGQPDYANAVVVARTVLAPEALLDLLQALENAAGRERLLRWGARTLDLDLLLYGDHVIRSERLVVPHAEMTVRPFVLQPLLLLWPSARLPDGRALADLPAARASAGLAPWPHPRWPGA